MHLCNVFIVFFPYVSYESLTTTQQSGYRKYVHFTDKEKGFQRCELIYPSLHSWNVTEIIFKPWPSHSMLNSLFGTYYKLPQVGNYLHHFFAVFQTRL